MEPLHFAVDTRLKKYILITSISFFVVSLTQKCYCTTSECGDSFMAFLLGWAALLSGGAGISWLANPLLFASWIILRKKLKLAMFLSVAALLFSLSFLMFDTVIANEAGQKHQIIAYKLGYWLWMGSNMVMLLGTFVLMLRHNTRIAKSHGFR